ncbi:MAG: cytochrome c oxidase assembly protein, partial [Gaiellaceae bacterium]
MSPPLFIVLAAGVLYWSGTRQLRRRTLESRARTAAFYGGLLTVLVALDSPLDGLAGKLFAAHMA